MMDIVDVQDGQDLNIQDSDVMRAANVLQVQIGDLEYAPTWGVDVRQFLESPVQFQDTVIFAHFLERLAQSQINVAESMSIALALYQQYVFSVGQPQARGGLQIQPSGGSS